ncbi:MAG: hypothetical protein WAW37_20630 [Syntrophobacteraceae bacterium]
MLDRNENLTIVGLVAEKGRGMGCRACKNDPGVWEKRSRRDALSIEIAVDVLRLSAGIIGVHYRTAEILFLTRRYLRQFIIESCVACSSWERCAPSLYEQFSRIHDNMLKLHVAMSGSPKVARLPFVFAILGRSVAKTVDMLSERVEDLSFVRDEESRAALSGLAQVCKEAGPKLEDWRKTMDFLN